MMKKIVIGCDHAGFEYKEHAKNYLEKNNVEVIDKGTYSPESVDYPDFVHPVAEIVSNNSDILGILVCGSGNGVAMTANKHHKVRAAVCWNNKLAALSRQHNNANVLAIPARFVSKKMSTSMISTFLSTPFDGGRHLRRVQKISNCGMD